MADTETPSEESTSTINSKLYHDEVDDPTVTPRTPYGVHEKCGGGYDSLGLCPCHGGGL